MWVTESSYAMAVFHDEQHGTQALWPCLTPPPVQQLCGSHSQLAPTKIASPHKLASTALSPTHRPYLAEPERNASSNLNDPFPSYHRLCPHPTLLAAQEPGNWVPSVSVLFPNLCLLGLSIRSGPGFCITFQEALTLEETSWSG